MNDSTVEELKLKGNMVFRDGRVADALSIYTRTIAIAAAAEEQAHVYSILHTNKLAVLLKLDRWEDAKVNEEEALKLDPTSTKAKYGLAMALLWLQHPIDVAAVISSESWKEFKELHCVAERVSQEQIFGNFDFTVMVANLHREQQHSRAMEQPALSDFHADFISSSIELNLLVDNGAGRCVKAKKPICENKLLIRCRAFSFYLADKNKPLFEINPFTNRQDHIGGHCNCSQVVRVPLTWQGPILVECWKQLPGSRARYQVR